MKKLEKIAEEVQSTVDTSANYDGVARIIEASKPPYTQTPISNASRSVEYDCDDGNQCDD